MSNIDKSVFLGSGEGPEPVWRNEAKDVDAWPLGAAFKIEFTIDAFGAVVSDEIRKSLPMVRYFGHDGWPLDFPVNGKGTLSDAVRLDLQVFPRNWCAWTRWEWETLLRAPHQCGQARGVAPRVCRVVESVGPFHIDR